MRSTIFATLLGLSLSHPGNAQNGPTLNDGNHPAVANGPLQTLTVTFQLMTPAPAISSSEDMTRAMTAATQTLYDIVNHECDVLTASLKGTCRITRLVAGGNFNDVNAPGALYRPGPNVNVNASATFEIRANSPALPVGTPSPK
jgi:hypothetical protein